MGVGEEEVPSQAEFFTGIIFSLVSPDTILKNSVLSTYWITHRVIFFSGRKTVIWVYNRRVKLQRQSRTCRGAPPLCRRAAPASSGRVIPPPRGSRLPTPPPPPPSFAATSPHRSLLLRALVCGTVLAGARRQLEVTPGRLSLWQSQPSRADRWAPRGGAAEALGLLSPSQAYSCA